MKRLMYYASGAVYLLGLWAFFGAGPVGLYYLCLGLDFPWEGQFMIVGSVGFVFFGIALGLTGVLLREGWTPLNELRFKKSESQRNPRFQPSAADKAYARAGCVGAIYHDGYPITVRPERISYRGLWSPSHPSWWGGGYVRGVYFNAGYYPWKFWKHLADSSYHGNSYY